VLASSFSTEVQKGRMVITSVTKTSPPAPRRS
jgi:hypothetical protein